MAEIPYTTVPAKIKPILDKVQIVGVPQTIDKKWLAALERV